MKAHETVVLLGRDFVSRGSEYLDSGMPRNCFGRGTSGQCRSVLGRHHILVEGWVLRTLPPPGGSLNTYKEQHQPCHNFFHFNRLLTEPNYSRIHYCVLRLLTVRTYALRPSLRRIR